MTSIISAGARKYGWVVSAAGRGLCEVVSEPISAERSRKGKLYGVGTGTLTLGSSFSGPVLWFRNDDADVDMFVQKLIFGWNGGSTNFNRTVFSLINYNTGVPTANETSINFQVENIKFASGSAPGTLSDATAYKWDGVGTAGMTGSTGGFAQIPNTLDKGNTSIQIDGEIVLGKGDTMRFDVTPGEEGVFHVAAVVYLAPAGGIEDEGA